MTAYDYSRPKATADRLLTRYGVAATLSRPTATGTAYNPTPGEPDEYPVTLVNEAYRNHEIDGTRIRATDKKIMLAKGDLAIEPATTDKLIIAGVEHSIVDVQPLAPGGVTVFWTIQARR